MVEFEKAKQRLQTLLRQRSLKFGDFLLSSGAKSSYYFDCKLTTLHPEGAVLVGQVVYALIRDEARKRGVRVQGVGGLTMGADPIALATSMQSFLENPGEALNCFVVRKTPKGHGQTKLIEGNFSKGDDVVVIDDVVTKGESTLAAIKAVEEAGGRVAFVVALVDRQEGGRKNIEDRGHGVISAFTKADLFDSPPA